MSSGTLRVDTKRKLVHMFYRAFEQTMASHAQLHPRFADESAGLAATEHGSPSFAQKLGGNYEWASFVCLLEGSRSS